MGQPLLIIDAHYLCYRAFYTSGHLSWGGNVTGVVFGFLKSIINLKHEFHTDKIAFCFEGSNLERRKVFPDYKRRRAKRERTAEEEKARAGFIRQVERLRKEWLPRIGFRNVFSYNGMESDDIMARIAKVYPGQMIMVTADHDLFQCLSPSVSIYNPQQDKMFTESWFRARYQIAPRSWAVVKAMAGCKSDNVPGIAGVGEATAVRYLSRKLREDSAAWRKIRENKEIVMRNRSLVALPHENCPIPSFRPDQITKQGWVSVCAELGMKSLAGRPPIYATYASAARRRKG